MSRTAVLFVCLGNICRSPLAEAAFRSEAERLGLSVEIDSAGTGDWHVGRSPDPRAIAAARRNGLDISHLRARQVTAEDFRRFDHIVALDRQNLPTCAGWHRQTARRGYRCCSTMLRGRWACRFPTLIKGRRASSTRRGAS
jgi:protein-tyrosine-phosphatase